jgi:small subunit ribosomal protein S2
VIDPKKEKNAIREARSLGVTTVALIDTDCDPDVVDLPIPGNDDGIRSIEVVLRHLSRRSSRTSTPSCRPTSARSATRRSRSRAAAATRAPSRSECRAA